MTPNQSISVRLPDKTRKRLRREARRRGLNASEFVRECVDAELDIAELSRTEIAPAVTK